MSARYHFSDLVFTLLQSYKHVYSHIRSADKFFHRCFPKDPDDSATQWCYSVDFVTLLALAMRFSLSLSSCKNVNKLTYLLNNYEKLWRGYKIFRPGWPNIAGDASPASPVALTPLGNPHIFNADRMSEWLGLKSHSTHNRSFSRWVFPGDQLHCYIQPKTRTKHHLHPKHKSETEITALPNITIYTLVWYAFYDLRPGNGEGPILTAPEPTWGGQS